MNIAIILSGGVGSRMKSDSPKQFMLLANRCVLDYSLSTFAAHDEIDLIVVVAAKEYLKKTRELTEKIETDKKIIVVEGGKTRQESVYLGLLAVADYSSDCITLIHDGARPFVTPQLISANIAAVEKVGAAVTAIPVTDTIFLNEANGLKAVDRSIAYAAQTPQSFRLGLILEAHRNFKNDIATDDCTLVQRMNKEICIVEGSRWNMKITLPEDIKIAEAIKNH